MQPTPQTTSGLLIQINLNFEPGGYIYYLVAVGTLGAECAKVFLLKRGDDTLGKCLLPYQHQIHAIDIVSRAA